MPNDIVIHVLAETKKAVDGLRQTQEEIRRLSEQTRTFTGMTAAFTGWAAIVTTALNVVQQAFGKLKQFLQECTEAASVNMEAMRRLNASLTISGRYSTETAKQFQQFADSLAAVTNYAGAEITRVVAHFTRLGLTEDIVRRATKVTLDFAAAMDTDLQSAALAVGKALGDPERGLVALRRQGVLITTQQQEFIRTLMASRREMEAQTTILQLLETQYRDFAAQASSAVKRMENEWNELKAALGAYVNDFKAAFATTILPGLRETRQELEKQRESGTKVTLTWRDYVGVVLGAVAEAFITNRDVGEVLSGASYDVAMKGFERLINAQASRPIMSKSLKEAEEIRRRQQQELEYYQRLNEEATTYLKQLQEENRLLGISAEYRKLAELQAKGLSEELATQIQQQIQLNEIRKAQLKVEEKLAALRQETQMAQMTETQRKLWELQQAGATAAQLEEARQLLAIQEQIRKQQEAQKQAQVEQNQMAKEAEAIRRDIMTEEQRILEQADRASKLLQAGLLTPQEYLAYLEKLKATIKPPEDLARQVQQQTQLAAALRFGTTEAYSAIMRAAMMAIRPPAGGPQEQVARNTQQIVERLDRLIATIKRQEAI